MIFKEKSLYVQLLCNSKNLRENSKVIPNEKKSGYFEKFGIDMGNSRVKVLSIDLPSN